jgi:LEA14-like dessication related protein
MRLFLVLILLLAANITAMGQQKLFGVVIDEKGQPLSKASVFIAESKIGTITDTTGKFILTVGAIEKFKVVVSYVGYETQTRSINIHNEAQPSKFELKPISKQLKDVIVRSRKNDDWKHWGKIFTDAFVGESAFAPQCTLLNKEVIGFSYDEGTKTLNAYATEPILIKNESLGYLLTISLVDFTLHTANNDVDYQGYYFFKELTAENKKRETWEQNRRRAYALSFMHFVRTLYNGKLKEDGFEVRAFKATGGAEKKRIKKIYDQRLAHYTDSLNDGNTELAVTLTEKSFNKDSLKYYKNALGKTDDIKLSAPLNADNIAIKNDGKYIALKFEDQIQVTYKKIKEPEEYYTFRNQDALNISTLDRNASELTTNRLIMPQKQYPYTELKLTDGTPVELTANGYISNTNLYMNGFWGWWEKIATKLPYDYQPF